MCIIIIYQQLHMGGMVYDEERQHGVKRKSIPHPRVMNFHKAASYNEVLDQARDIFFSDAEHDVSHYSLAGPLGVPYEISDPEDWVLQEFMKEHDFQPSKLRLYSVFNAKLKVISCYNPTLHMKHYCAS